MAKTAKTGMAAFCCIALVVLTGCVGDGLELASSTKVDRSLSTGTVPQSSTTQDAISDETTVRNAVSSADLAKLNGQPLPWANASTGSAGVIDTIVEVSDSGQICRQFKTSRHSYSGVANFFGKTCLVVGSEWQLLSFQQDG